MAEAPSLIPIYSGGKLSDICYTEDEEWALEWSAFLKTFVFLFLISGGW
jgi:hypothetical protein